MLTPTIALPLLLGAMAAEPDEFGCGHQMPAALPPPPSNTNALNAVVDIFEEQTFLIRSDEVRNFRLSESPTAPGVDPMRVDLDAADSQFVVEGVRYELFEAPSLPLGRCFEMLESDGFDGGFRRSGVYQNALLCVTNRGAPDDDGPQTPTVEVTASKPSFGRPSNDDIPVPAIFIENCGVVMTYGSGNISSSISGISSTPSVLVVELLKDGQPEMLREILYHGAMRDTQQPVVVQMSYERVMTDLQVRVTHRTLSGETGTPVVADVVVPGGCHGFPTATVWLLLSAAALRRRRKA